MMINPFVLYELDFDSEMFRKYYGSIENPGIYAIPEDEVEPPSPEENDDVQDFGASSDNPHPEEDDHQTDTSQTMDNKQQIEQKINQINQIPNLQLSPDETNAVNKEVEPIKKFFLINKLYQLSYLLKSNLMANEELDTILKFSAFLSYRTLQVLAINIVNNLKNETQTQQEGNGVPVVQ